MHLRGVYNKEVILPRDVGSKDPLLPCASADNSQHSMVKSVWQQNEMSSQGWVDRNRRMSFTEEIGSSYKVRFLCSRLVVAALTTPQRIPNYNPQYATYTDPRAQYRPSPQTPARARVILPGEPDPSTIPRRPPTPPRNPPQESLYLIDCTLEHEPGSDSDSSSDEEDSELPAAPKEEPRLTIRIPPLAKNRPKYIPELDEVVTMGKRRREDDLPNDATSATSSSGQRRETPDVSVETFEVAEPFDDDDDDDMEVDQPLATITRTKSVLGSSSRSPPRRPLRPRPRQQKRLSGSYASFGMSSPLKPEDVTTYYTCVCTMPGCVFAATSDAHLKHHMRTFQHGKISTPGRFEDEMIEEDVKDDPMEMI